MTVLQIPVQDLRRVARALQELRGGVIDACVMRSDLRQLKVELHDGRMLVVALESDDHGRPYLAVDVVAAVEEGSRQLEVGLEAPPE